TLRYKSTVKILPPSLPPERVKVDDFHAARSRLILPLPWPTFSPPFSQMNASPIYGHGDRDRQNDGRLQRPRRPESMRRQRCPIGMGLKWRRGGDED
ncbi:hypothetical protein NHG85_01235, partial [Limimaricola sp. ASW11-118]